MSLGLHAALFASVPRCEPVSRTSPVDAPTPLEVTRLAALLPTRPVTPVPHPVGRLEVTPGRGETILGAASPAGSAGDEGGDGGEPDDAEDGAPDDPMDLAPSSRTEAPAPRTAPSAEDPLTAEPVRVPQTPPATLEWVQTLADGAAPTSAARIGSHTRSGPDDATRGPTGTTAQAAQSLGNVVTGAEGERTPRAAPDAPEPTQPPRPTEPAPDDLPEPEDDATPVDRAPADESLADAASAVADPALPEVVSSVLSVDPTLGSEARPDRTARDAQGTEGVQREAADDGLLPAAIDAAAAALASEAQAARAPAANPSDIAPVEPPALHPARQTQAADPSQAPAIADAARPSATTPPASKTTQWTSEALPDVLIQATRRGVQPAGSAGGAGGAAAPAGAHYARVGPTSLAGAVSTPLGVYLDEVERVVAARWSSAELPLVERVLGRGGEVVLEFRVRRSGEVRDLRVSRPSGLGALDAAALGSIPDRLPPIPRELGLRSYLHRLTLTWSPGRVR